jgi:hypothetical protein
LILTEVAYILSGLVGLGITFVGARFLLAPKVAMLGFGVSIAKDGRGADAYLAAKGVRDIVSGLFVFILIVNGSTRLLGLMILAATLIPIGDALNVILHGGPRLTAYSMHGGTALVMLLTAGLLLAGSS